MLNGKITEFIREYMEVPEHNTLRDPAKDPGEYLRAWEEPLVGFSRGDDPLYPFYKNHIDPLNYFLPEEFMEKTFGHSFEAAELSVVSWALPQSGATKALCHSVTDCSPLEWQWARTTGEACNRALADALVLWLRGQGYEAAAPITSPLFRKLASEKFVWVSNWSERHTAHISGLGTFGLCDGLITKKGKAVRFGSVIVKAKLVPTQREYTEYNEYCLAKYGCTACIERCPAKAISVKGHDKKKCAEYHADFIAPACHERYGYDGYSVCGLCQTCVPCENGIPGRKRK